MIEAIKKRTSCRTFEQRPLSYEDESKVEEILKDVEKKKGPFNHHAKFFSRVNKNEKAAKYANYGFIKHPPMFIGGVIRNSFEGLVDYEFLLEEVILRLTEASLGTVWLGGAFNNDDFHVHTGPLQTIPAIAAVGYPAKRSLPENLSPSTEGAKRRKPFDSLFFHGESLEKVPEDSKYRKYLEAVRQGPSASNKQPWRIVLIDHTFHLYLKRTGGQGEKVPVDIQAIDAGIALSHLYLTLKEDGYAVTFNQDEPLTLSETEYVLSMQAEKNSNQSVKEDSE